MSVYFGRRTIDLTNKVELRDNVSNEWHITDTPALDAVALQKVQAAGPGFYAAAAAAARDHGANWQAICKAAQAASGAKGANLYRPLRLALTGNEQGPDLGTFLLAMPADEIQRRLQRFAI